METLACADSTDELNFYRGTALVELLMMSESHLDEEPTEEELAPLV